MALPELSLTHRAKTTQSAGGTLGGAGPVKPGGPEGSDAVLSDSEKTPTWLPVTGIRTVGDDLRQRAGEGDPNHHCYFWSLRTD